LLHAVEQYAKKVECLEVWEALSKNHPFAKESNSLHDAYGFYKEKGYAISDDYDISWKNEIPCNLLTKII